jgi:hypothetical protein
MRHVDPEAELSGLLGPAWAALQARHPELPACAFEPLPRGERERYLARAGPPGYLREDGSPYTEPTVVIAPGFLGLFPAGAFRLLMHEAAHVLDYRRRQQAKGGRAIVSGHAYRFAAIAREMGLAGSYGRREGRVYYDVRLTSELRERYAAAIKAMEGAWPAAQQWLSG